ncbi:hypothetical protein A3770_04p27610 [Chloropicon primus]|uniref:Uncharacterized protein n=1 Tax=Chloropicon primus TaxID=1764295 RepID=A0A5B8MIG7_9CHLO|nr:hypothetical protein A3770_04p27610 [Chloropicon primus]|eukprot:QDZ20243.1 hypothetical protein A3770_04p27610 [Chloropicon primus]
MDRGGGRKARGGRESPVGSLVRDGTGGRDGGRNRDNASVTTTPEKLLYTAESSPYSLTKKFHMECEEYITFLELEHQANRFNAMEKEAEVEVLKHNLACARAKLDEVLRLALDEASTTSVSDLQQSLLYGLGLDSSQVSTLRYDHHNIALETFRAQQEALERTISDLEAKLHQASGSGLNSSLDLYRSYSKVEFELFSQHEQVSKNYDALLAGYMAMADKVKKMKQSLFGMHVTNKDAKAQGVVG